jgi:hypothetical protein
MTPQTIYPPSDQIPHRRVSTRPPRLPITSRVWFFPTLILLMPILSRACLLGLPSKPRPAAPSNEQICIDQYEECVALCESSTDTETDTDTGETDTGESDCVMICDEELDNCLEFAAPETPNCDPQDGYCGYAEDYEYGEPVEEYPSEESTWDWGCDSSDDDYYYEDDSSLFSCDYSDDYDDYSEESTDEGGGFDCSSDSYDEGDSGDDSDDWGEDWGEHAPAGGDGLYTPTDLPTDE